MSIGNAEGDIQVIETQTAKVWLSVEGIVFLIHKPQVEVTLERMLENIAALTEACKVQKRPILADIRQMKSADWNVRDQGQQLGHIVKSAATVASSPTTVVLSNLFLLIDRPSFPNHLFRSETEALVWLKEFLQ